MVFMIIYRGSVKRESVVITRITGGLWYKSYVMILRGEEIQGESEGSGGEDPWRIHMTFIRQQLRSKMRST